MCKLLISISKRQIFKEFIELFLINHKLLESEKILKQKWHKQQIMACQNLHTSKRYENIYHP